jgi:hypothetical protein
MSTQIRKPNENQILAWMRANPDASDDEVRAYAEGAPPSPQRFGTTGLLGKAVALGRGAGQGATFGLLDEGVGAIVGAVDPDKTWREGIADERAINKEVREGNKGTFMAGEIGGGIAQGVGAAGLAIGRSAALASLLGRTTLGGRVAAGAGAGAAGGGLAAFGGAEGNPVERVGETAVGAGAGALLGGALPVAGTVMRALGNASGVRPALVNPARESADMINEAIRQGDMSPDQIIAVARQNPSVPQTALDVGPDQVRDLALTAQSRSNTARVVARDALEGRIEGERDRYIGRLQKSLNPGDKDILETAAELRDLRSVNASRNFPAALEKTVEDVEIAKFFREPEVRRAYTEFRQNQLTLGVPADEVVPEIYEFSTNEAGKKVARLKTVGIPMKAFHMVQQALNDAIDTGMKNGKTIPEARAKTLRDALAKHMDKVDELVPEYGAARKVYRDDSALIDALEAGQGNRIKKDYGRSIPDFAKAPKEHVDKWLVEKRAAAAGGDDHAAAEVEHYMLGAYGFLRKQMKGRASVGSFVDLPKNREKIVALMNGDRAQADAFVKAIKAESRMKPTNTVNRKGTGIQGDETVPSAAMDILLAGAGVSGGRGYAATSAIARLLRGDHRMSDVTANATMQRLFKGVGGVDELVRAMEDLKNAAKLQELRRAKKTALTAGAASGAAQAIQD